MSDDRDKLIKQLKQQISGLETEKAKANEPDHFRGYSCTKCGQKVNISFLLPVIKNSGLCPTCFHET